MLSFSSSIFLSNQWEHGFNFTWVCESNIEIKTLFENKRGKSDMNSFCYTAIFEFKSLSRLLKEDPDSFVKLSTLCFIIL
ncbi:hypothetical protein A0128_01665 [Leptospira tipperaryensis]|uniref:Uncharacterized protein n=1 Tax=Leptospira tipperaryensis TaxID=2564040 RepID=A0A1D7USU3_9LEPT|nr:hypothetical protein A0128_01665 [Leptospira tipperaryensis]